MPIHIVSGVDNDKPHTIAAHKALQQQLLAAGFDPIQTNPDWPRGNLDDTKGTIHDLVQESVKTDGKTLIVGCSAGGSIAAEVRSDFDPDKVGLITLFSRFDLTSEPRTPNARGEWSYEREGRTPDAQDLLVHSPMLVAVVERLMTPDKFSGVNPINTICFTAGDNDDRVPYKSSTIAGAEISQIPVVGHKMAVGSILYGAQPIIDFAKRFVNQNTKGEL